MSIPLSLAGNAQHLAASAGALPIDCAGHTLWLLPQGAVWWPQEKTLLVADVHIGKGAAFRAGGLPVPTGSSAGDLARLTALVRQWQACRLVILGDLWHCKTGLTDAVLQDVKTWLAQLAEVEVVLVEGNHDRHSAAPALPLKLHKASLELAANFIACHEPLYAVAGLPPRGRKPKAQPLVENDSSQSTHSMPFALAGHLHPAVRVHGCAGDAMRLQCFVWQANQLLLPAFGGLTGSLTLDVHAQHAAGSRIALLADSQVVWLPASVPNTSAF